MKRGTPRHPKVLALAETLGIRRRDAVGLLEMLFHFTAEFAPQGDIGRYPDKMIAAAVDWAGKPEKLIHGLVGAKWIDTHPEVRLVVHDWEEHADRSVHQRLARHGKITIKSNHIDTVEVTPQCAPLTRVNDAPALPVPVPEPVPTKLSAASHLNGSKSGPPSWKPDSAFEHFTEMYKATGASVIPDDFIDAIWAWQKLDFEQRIERQKSLEKHFTEYSENPRFIPKPRKFLESEWQRPLKPAPRKAQPESKEIHYPELRSGK